MGLLGFGAPAAMVGALAMLGAVPMGFLALVLGTGATVSARRDHEPAGPATIGLICGALVVLSCVVFLVIAMVG
jgi:hypothetical protein